MEAAQGFLQASGVENPLYRENWTRQKIEQIAQTHSGSSLLDVGAGTGPYREYSVSKGFTYTAHDFGAYLPSGEDLSQSGMHNATWDYTALDYRCDLLDLPDDARADVVLCTEVLEHVPDPVSALRKLASLTAPGGDLLVTVPFLSLMHQAPHWYASGLSPFFFQTWCPQLGLQIEELTVHGDYADLMRQETERLVTDVLKRPFNGRVHRRVVAPVVGAIMRRARRRLSHGVLSSGGFGVTLHASKAVPKVAIRGLN